jgi:hypothetical protein
MAFRMPVRTMASAAARSTLRVGLIPADGIGREVIPVRRPRRSRVRVLTGVCAQSAMRAIMAVDADLPKVEFTDLLAGFEHFQKTGTALPEETVRRVHVCAPDPLGLTLLQDAEGELRLCVVRICQVGVHAQGRRDCGADVVLQFSVHPRGGLQLSHRGSPEEDGLVCEHSPCQVGSYMLSVTSSTS